MTPIAPLNGPLVDLRAAPKKQVSRDLETRMVSGWNEVHQGPPDDLIARIAEHSAAGVVHFGDEALGIRDKDAVRGLLNQIAQAFLALGQRALGGRPRR